MSLARTATVTALVSPFLFITLPLSSVKNKSKVLTTLKFSSRFLTNSFTSFTFCSLEFWATKWIPVTSLALNFTVTSSSPGNLATSVSFRLLFLVSWLSSFVGLLGCSTAGVWVFSSDLGCSGVTWGFSSGLGCSGVTWGFSSGLGCAGVTWGFSSTLGCSAGFSSFLSSTFGSSFLTSASTVVISSTNLSSILVAFFSNRVLVILYLSPAFISLSVISSFLSSSLETLVELSSLTSLPRIRSTLVTIYQLRP